MFTTNKEARVMAHLKPQTLDFIYVDGSDYHEEARKDIDKDLTNSPLAEGIPRKLPDDMQNAPGWPALTSLEDRSSIPAGPSSSRR